MIRVFKKEDYKIFAKMLVKMYLEDILKGKKFSEFLNKLVFVLSYDNPEFDFNEFKKMIREYIKEYKI